MVQNFSWEDEKVMETDNGDGYTTVWMHLVPLNYTIKMIKMVSFMLRIFYHNKKQEVKFWGQKYFYFKNLNDSLWVARRYGEWIQFGKWYKTGTN